MLVELSNDRATMDCQREGIDGERSTATVRKSKRGRPDAGPGAGADADATARGMTTEEVARLYRVSPDKVRAWIKRGELRAINTAKHRCGKPRYVITPAGLAAFEQSHAVEPPAPKPQRRRPLPKDFIDYFPD